MVAGAIANLYGNGGGTRFECESYILVVEVYERGKELATRAWKRLTVVLPSGLGKRWFSAHVPPFSNTPGTSYSAVAHFRGVTAAVYVTRVELASVRVGEGFGQVKEDFDYVISEAETDIMRPQVHHGGSGAVAMDKGQEVDKGIYVKEYLEEPILVCSIMNSTDNVLSKYWQTTSPSMLGDDTHERPYASEVVIQLRKA
ncbi:hypothetical protein Tco_0682636 [Tanacetum coccineum]|uniref:Uncharacterized protein n=1 Tax=Tanacetum coccineum TaxID=301880 RepID=A0ABQ4XT98_9ASTR